MKTFSFKKFPFYTALILILVSARLSLLASDTNLPAPASVQINFDRDIHPILETSCLRCHGSQKPKSHFRLDYREGALAGGDNNTNDIVPGDSGNSLLIAYVARQVPDMEMPPTGKGNPLTPQQISLLRAWIDQGANWNTTNQPSPLDLIFEPTVRDFIVNGNQQEFRELEGTRKEFPAVFKTFQARRKSARTKRFPWKDMPSLPTRIIMSDWRWIEPTLASSMPDLINGENITQPTAGMIPLFFHLNSTWITISMWTMAMPGLILG